MKVRGYRIELGEIEAVLREQPGVREAVVLVAGEGEDRRLVGYVVGDGWSGRELRRGLRERLPEYMVPAAYVELEELPLTGNGKVDRKRLPEAVVESEAEYEEPSPGTEAVVAGAWRELLGVERVGRRDNFFELGGHSLLATRLVSRIRSALHVELSLRSVFLTADLADLAALCDRQRALTTTREDAR